MNIQMNTAATTMRELQKKIDTIANNIANVNTTGYKRQGVSFSDALVQSMEKQAGNNETGRQTPNGLRIGNGAVITQITTNNRQGNILETNRPLDFMLQGETVFFRVSSNATGGENTYYTRDGSFQLRPTDDPSQLYLVTTSGQYVLDSNGQPIVIDDDFSDVTMGGDGSVIVTYKDPAKASTEFQFSIAEITRTDLLERAGSNLYTLSGDEAVHITNGFLRLVELGDPEQSSTIGIRQGSLEISNVDLTEEMTELIATQRLLQSQGRAISFADDMMGLVNNMRG
ncbi:MAG: flagellar hook-basal body protein [Bacillus sp. (in: Bacteria)]|nr:flagellar hook-basal body protein [Bacillus sp. (in: firmicutes)]